ncbi:RsmD family RNA methyltransferase, partial [Roseomonas mucosa]
RERVEGALVLDAFAGTGALGLEALSRGASRACFIERDRAALAVLRANLAACRVGETEGRVIAGDATRPPRAESACGLIFLDPPYGAGLPGMVLPALRGAGWVAPGALCCLETGRAEDMPDLPGWEPLAEREHGAARVLVLRDTGA